jgi:hypothetical protein
MLASAPPRSDTLHPDRPNPPRDRPPTHPTPR